MGKESKKEWIYVYVKLKMLAPWKESYDKPRQYIKKQRYHFANKGLYSQNFAGSPVWM